MEYIDFTQKRIELHEELENAIRSLMREKNVTEIDLMEREDEFERAWLIRSSDYDGSLEEVQVTALKLEGEDLYYKAFGCCGIVSSMCIIMPISRRSAWRRLAIK